VRGVYAFAWRNVTDVRLPPGVEARSSSRFQLASGDRAETPLFAPVDDDTDHLAAVTQQLQSSADGPRPDDDEAVRLLLLKHGSSVGEDVVLVDGERRDLVGPRAGGDDDVLGLGGLLLADVFVVHVGGGRDLDRPLPGERAVPVEHVDVVLFHQVLHALIHLVRGAAAALDDLLEVGGDLAVEFEAEVVEMVHVGHDLGAAQEGLRGNAADVEADAPELVFLDDGRVEPELGGADGRLVAAGPGANDDAVVGGVRFSVCHVVS